MKRYPVICSCLLIGGLLTLAGCQSEKRFEAYLNAKGLSHLTEAEREIEKDKYETRLKLAKHITSSGLVDVGKLDAELERIRLDRLQTAYFEKLYQREISQAAIETYYRDHQADFQSEQYRLAHILLKYPAQAGDTERAVTATTASEIQARLRAGESFGALANTYSEDPKTSTKGGELGWVTLSQLNDELQTAVRSLNVDGETLVVEAPYGLHVLQQLSPSRQFQTPLRDVRARIVSALRSRVKSAEMQKFKAEG